MDNVTYVVVKMLFEMEMVIKLFIDYTLQRYISFFLSEKRKMISTIHLLFSTTNVDHLRKRRRILCDFPKYYKFFESFKRNFNFRNNKFKF